MMRQTHLFSYFNHDATGVNCLICVLHVIDYLELSDLVLNVMFQLSVTSVLVISYVKP